MLSMLAQWEMQRSAIAMICDKVMIIVAQVRTGGATTCRVVVRRDERLRRGGLVAEAWGERRDMNDFCNN